MSETTKIEWADKTWNPVRGCSLVSAGCTNCYAMRFAHRFSGPGKPYEGLTRLGPNGPVWTGEISLVEDALLEPLHWRQPCRVFVNSMSDLFHEGVPDSFIDRVMAVIALCPRHTFQVLTKRSKRMREYSENKFVKERVRREVMRITYENECRLPPNWAELSADGIWPLPNLHLYVSIEDQATADARIPDLLATPAAVRGISLEPMLGPVDLTRVHAYPADPDARGIYLDVLSDCGTQTATPWGINHVILGGESGPGARPMHPDWARKVRDDCAAAGVPFFLKQWGEWIPSYELEDEGCRCKTPHEEGCPHIHLWGYTGGGGPAGYEPRDVLVSRRIGKKAAGRRLDGVEHNAMPGTT